MSRPSADPTLDYFKLAFGPRLHKHGPSPDWAVHADSDRELALLLDLKGRGLLTEHDTVRHRFALSEAGVTWLRAAGY